MSLGRACIYASHSSSSFFPPPSRIPLPPNVPPRTPQVATTDGIDAILNALRSYPEEVGTVAEALSSIQELATGANESNRTELAQKGAIALIIAAMGRHANAASVRMIRRVALTCRS